MDGIAKGTTDRGQKLVIRPVADDEPGILTARFFFEHGIAVAARHDCGHFGMVASTAQDQVQAIVGAEAKAGDQQVGYFEGYQSLCFFEGGRRHNAIARRFEQRRGACQVGRVGIYQEHTSLVAQWGSSKGSGYH